MTTYSTISNNEVDVDSPLTQSVATKYRDNPIAIAERSSGAPLVVGSLQTVSTTSTAILSVNVAAANIPRDNSIPQSSEGLAFMNVSITPKSATSKLIVEYTVIGGSNLGFNAALPLFKDAEANARYTVPANPNGGTPTAMHGRYEMIAGTVSLINFKVRVGYNTAGWFTNSAASTAAYTFGNTAFSSLTVTEVIA